MVLPRGGIGSYGHDSGENMGSNGGTPPRPTFRLEKASCGPGMPGNIGIDGEKGMVGASRIPESKPHL